MFSLHTSLPRHQTFVLPNTCPSPIANVYPLVCVRVSMEGLQRADVRDGDFRGTCSERGQMPNTRYV